MPLHRSWNSPRFHQTGDQDCRDASESKHGYNGDLNYSPRHDDIHDNRSCIVRNVENYRSRFNEDLRRHRSPDTLFHHRRISPVSEFNMKISIPASRVYTFPPRDHEEYSHEAKAIKASLSFRIDQNNFGGSVDREYIRRNSKMNDHHKSRQSSDLSVKNRLLCNKDRNTSPLTTRRGVSSMSQLHSKSSRKRSSRTPLKDIHIKSSKRYHKSGSLAGDIGNSSPRRSFQIRSNVEDKRKRSPISREKSYFPRSNDSLKRNSLSKSPKQSGHQLKDRDRKTKSIIRDSRIRSPSLDYQSRSSVRDVRSRSPARAIRVSAPKRDLKPGLSSRNLKSKSSPKGERLKLSIEDRLGPIPNTYRSPNNDDLPRLSIDARLRSPSRRRSPRPRSRSKSSRRFSKKSKIAPSSTSSRSTRRNKSRSPLKDNSLSELLKSAKELEDLARKKNSLENEFKELYQSQSEDNQLQTGKGLLRVKNISFLTEPVTTPDANFNLNDSR